MFSLNSLTRFNAFVIVLILQPDFSISSIRDHDVGGVDFVSPLAQEEDAFVKQRYVTTVT